jgi:ankyrin repeat protein/tRNA A-37 threonylcarbamoyl transferase component Bud32
VAMKDKDLVEILENLGYSILSSPKILKHTEIEGIESITFSADSKYLISYDLRTVGIWSIPDGKLIRVIKKEDLDEKIETSIIVSSNGKYLAYGISRRGFWREKKFIKIYSIPDFKLINELRYDPSYGYLLKEISPDGKYLVFSKKVINILSESGIKNIDKDYSDLAFSPDGKYIAIFTGNEIKIRALSDGLLVKTIPREQFAKYTFSPDSKYLASWDDHYIKIWSIPDGNLIKEIQVNSTSLKSITFHPKGKYLVALGEDYEKKDNKVCIWSLFDYSLIKTFSLEGYNDFSDLVFSPDGKYLALKGKEEIVVFNTELLNLLQYEYTNSDIEKLQKLLNLDINKMFILSVRFDSKENIKELLERGADVNAKDKDGTSALIYAVKRGDVEIVKMLLERGADVNIKDQFGNSALIYAVKRGDVKIVRMLLDREADINVKSIGLAMLMEAFSKESTEIVKMLLDKVDIDNSIDNNEKLLIYGLNALIEKGDKEGVKLIVQRDLGMVGIFLRSIYKGYIDIIEMLIEKGLDVNARYDWYYRYYSAAFEEKEDIYIGRRKDYNMTLLMYACGFTWEEFVEDSDYICYFNTMEVILSKRSEIENVNLTKLKDVVKLLLDKGADVNAKDREGRTALMWAASSGNVDIVKILLDAGADISAKNEDGETALMLAQRNKQVDTMKILEAYLLNKYVGKQQESISYDVKKTILSSREESISEVERDYDIIREIGRGGMCKVYEIKDKKLGKKYAMKVLSDELRVSRRERERFLQEAKRIAMIDKHEAIVDIYRVIDETDKGGNIYLILEYVDGKTINEILDERGRIDWKEVVRIVLDICEALSFAHKNKVIHRDLKPSNIMLTIDGKVKILDFGIARELKDTISRISGKDTSGTLVYMSPEQHLGSYDERSDIYSLGVTMYEMLTGEVPFKGPEFYLQKTHMVYRPASEIVPDIPKRIDEIIAKCLQADKEKRYQSVEELLNDLKELNSL